MGEPEEVSSIITRRLVDIEAEDTGVATVKFSNGALGVIEATTATRPKDIEGSISILGESGIVEISGFAMNEMKVWQFSDERPDDLEVLTKFRENPPNVYGFGHVRYFQNVVDCLKGNKEIAVDGYDAKKSLQFIVALYESAEKGIPVKLSDMTGKCKLGLIDGK
jgi:predicted dehydrogenase